VRVLKLFTLLGAIVPAIAVAAPRPATLQLVKSDQEVLVELEKSWNEAFYSKDLKFIESILADEFMSTYEDGSRADKKKELAATAAFDQQVVEAVQDDFTVKIFGDTAVVWFTLHLVGIKQGQRSELTLSYTDVWVLRDGNWRCVSAHSTRVTSK
jgi:ketosteroid isomerase-like protein